MKIEVELVICEAERCAMTGRFRAGIPGSAKGFDMLMSSFFRLAEGRIAEEWVQANSLPSMVGIGYQTAPPGAEIRRPDGSLRQDPAKAPLPAVEAPGPRTLCWLPPLADPPDLDQRLRAYIDVVSTGRVSGLEDLVTEGFRRSDFHRRVSGREDMARFVHELHDIYGAFHFEVLDLVVQDRIAAARLVMRGELSGSGRNVAVPILAFYWFDETGRIETEFPLGDYVGYLEDLGYRITLPGETIVMPPIADAREPPEPRSPAAEAALEEARAELEAAAPRSAAGLEIHSPVGCHLELDRRRLGFLRAGQTLTLSLPKGEHRLRALSLRGSAFFQRELKLKGGSRNRLEIEVPSRMIVDPRRRVAEDLETGLLWPIQDQGSDLDWEEAEAHCRDLEQGGYSDWRLPHIRELLSLYEPRSSKRWKTPSGVTLTSCCPWSATHHDEWRAWNLVSYKGTAGLQPIAFRRYQRALCVHDL